MKRLLCILLLAAISLCCFGLAETEETSFITHGDHGKPLKILFESISADTYSINSDGEPIFDDYILETLMNFQRENSLAETGKFDIETLSFIFGLQSPEEDEPLVWIPMHGGSKYHKHPDCSNMIEPRQVPSECAMLLEFDACKRCKPAVHE